MAHLPRSEEAPNSDLMSLLRSASLFGGVPEEELLDEATNLAQTLAARAPLALGGIGVAPAARELQPVRSTGDHRLGDEVRCPEDEVVDTERVVRRSVRGPEVGERRRLPLPPSPDQPVELVVRLVEHEET